MLNRDMRTENSFYNTTSESGFRLRVYEAEAVAQEEQLLGFFEDNPSAGLTRAELHKVILTNVPVSSITRALANLKKRGKVERTTDKRDGEYGHPQCIWRLAPPLMFHTPDMF